MIVRTTKQFIVIQDLLKFPFVSKAEEGDLKPNS